MLRLTIDNTSSKLKIQFLIWCQNSLWINSLIFLCYNLVFLYISWRFTSFYYIMLIIWDFSRNIWVDCIVISAGGKRIAFVLSAAIHFTRGIENTLYTENLMVFHYSRLPRIWKTNLKITICERWNTCWWEKRLC